MKKTMFLVLAIVLVMGTLGVAYASWTDKVNINGTVNTGNVHLTRQSYSGTWVWKVANMEDEIDITQTSIYPYPANLEVPNPIGWCNAGPGATPKDIKVEFHNLFPLEPLIENYEGEPMPWEANFVLLYDGTIPVKFNVANLLIQWDANSPHPNADLTAEIQAWVTPPLGTKTLVGDAAALLGTQIEPNTVIEIDVLIQIVNSANDPALDQQNMKCNGTITGEIGVIQWNEFD